MSGSGAAKGMMRRASSSSAHASVATSVTRVHRSNDSHHGFVGTHPTHAGLPTLNAAASTSSPQDKVVVALIKRLTSKLPCYSGLTLAEIESDDTIELAIQSLAELARHALDKIVWKLSEELEKLARQTDSNGYRAMDVLQSQLFLLKVMSVTMSNHWQHNKAESSRLQSASESTSGHGHSNGTTPTSPTHPISSLKGATPRQYMTQASYDRSSPASLWLEAPPLDEACAKWLISLVVHLLRQATPRDSRSMWYGNLNFDATLFGFESVESENGNDCQEMLYVFPPEPPEMMKPHPPPQRGPRKHPSLTSMASAMTASIPIPRSTQTFRATARTLTSSSLSLHSLVGKWAGNIVYLLSASNWSVVFSRIRHKIRGLSQPSSEESVDIVDLQLMQYCAFDRGRLIQMMQELSSLLVNMSRDAQAAVAMALRKAIWNWIDNFPNEYNDVVNGSRRLDGAPERLFDLFFQISEAGNKSAIWPAMSLLMVTSHDRLKGIAMMSSPAIGANKANKKECQYKDQIAKNMNPASKLLDIALLASIDMCRAASRARPEGDVVLRSIAPEVGDDIKGVLWKAHNQRPFYESPDSIDVALFADAMVAMFRFLPEDESMHMFTACLEPERSDAVKMCAVKACVILAQEAPRFPWQPTMKTILRRIAPRLRNIYRSAVLRRNEVDDMGNIKRAMPRPNAKRYTGETIADRELLVLGILALYRIDPRFYIPEKADMEDWVSDTVQVLLRPGDPAAPLSSVRTFMQASRWVLDLRPGDEYFEEGTSWIGKAIPSALLCASTRLLDARDDFDEQRMCIEMACGILSLYALGHADDDNRNSWRLAPDRIPAVAVAELAFLVSLTSADNGVSTMATKGLRGIAILERHPNAPINPGLSEEERLMRHPIYEQLGDPKVMAVGRVGHQRRLRKLLRSLAFPCPMHAAVWLECYWRWSALEESVSRRSIDGLSSEGTMNGQRPIGDRTMSPEERLFQWQNLTLFLAAFGAAGASEDLNSHLLTSIIPANHLPDRFRVLQDGDEIIKNFITSAVDFLIADSVHARDCAKEALGAELSPRLYSRLFKRLNDVIEDIMQTSKDSEGETPEPEEEELFLVFFEQFVAVLKLAVDRVDSLAESVFDNVDLGQTLLSLAKFIDRFTAASSLRVKVKFCAFCDSALARSDSFGLRRDDKLRQSLLEAIVEWIQPSTSPNEESGSLGRFLYEANMSGLKTVVKLLEGLRLQSLEGGSPDDAAHSISRRFSRYQSLLMQALSSARPDDPLTADDASVHSTSSNRKDRVAEMRELVITGLTHLLSSNTDVGFKHCLQLGYDADPIRRLVFCHVIARVLWLGGKFDVVNHPTMLVRRSRLCELVKGSDMTLALAICETCPPSDTDILIPVMLNLFDSRASLMSLLKLIIEKEVRTAPNEVALFRGNSMRTLLLCAFAKLHGYDYLRSVLKPLIDQMCALPDDCSFELDPAKALPGQDIKKNQETVKFVTQAFLDIICSSVSALPPMIREICIHISKTVADVWHEAKFSALGAFIFLRFISPTMVSPDTVDIEIPRNNVTIRRGLLIVTKIIQNLANNILFGKEAHMMVFNEFLSENIVRITRFLSDLNKYTPTDDEPEEWLGGTFDESDAIVLHRFFEKHADKVGKELLGLSMPSSQGEPAATGGKRSWDALCGALVEMGLPTGVPHLSPLSSAEFSEYLSFMARTSDRSIDPVRNLFWMATSSKDMVNFVLDIRKFDVEVLDFELLLYHIFKTVTSPDQESRPFSIVIDSTGFTTASEIPIQWFKFAVELLPSDIKDRFKAFHILNANILMQRYLRKLYNVCAGLYLSSDIRAYHSVKELGQRINGDIASTLEYASHLEQEQGDVFSDLTLRQAQLMKMRVDVKIAQTYIRITSVKAQVIFPNLAGKITEIVPLSDVDDIYNVTTGRDANEFIVRRSRNGGTLYFASPEREQIIKAIRLAKGRLKTPMTVALSRNPKLSNVSATLLNIGMNNTMHQHSELRHAAHDLLSAVCLYIEYDGSPSTQSRARIAPAYSTTSVVLLSERLAAFMPKLTLDFLSEACLSLESNPVSQRINSLHYISPWIRNLGYFCDPASKYYEHSGAKLRDCVRLLIDITMRDQQAYSSIQKHIWSEVAKLDHMLVNIVLDELMRAAVDGGVGSRRCDIMADTLASLSSINVRGRLISRLRKTLGKASVKPTKSLADNAHWGEIAVFTRLALVTGYHSRQTTFNQLFFPEIIHLATLLAGTGETVVRHSVYGLVMNLLQSMGSSRGDELPSDIRNLIDDFTQPETLHLFGLTRTFAASEYSNYDPTNDQQAIDMLEGLSRLLLRAVNVCAGNGGLANVWRARWMSLLTATAFQLSLAIQPRAFIVMGTLAPSDVDDDLLYQMLVALKSAMKVSDESDTTCVVSMLRCICNLVHALPENSRYLPQVFWLSVALLQSSHAAFYMEATSLLCASLHTLHAQGLLQERGFTATLLDARAPLEEISIQLDRLLGVSFESSFSFSLASVIFKGMRRPQLREHAAAALNCLLTTALSTSEISGSSDGTVHPDILGYFLALLPVSTTLQSYQQLLTDAGVGQDWFLADEATGRMEGENGQVPRVAFDLLGCVDANTALLVTSFVATMLSTAQGDDVESQMLFTLLSDAASAFPETVSLSYEGLQEKIYDTFASSTNPNILSAVSTIFRGAMEDPIRGIASKGSASTLSTVEESSAFGPGRRHLLALEELSMQGIASTFQFLPLNRGHATKMLQWFPEIIARII
ncbi:hypothetical protein BD410DRAFT_780416, partial [Rickenella mellea]